MQNCFERKEGRKEGCVSVLNITAYWYVALSVQEILNLSDKIVRAPLYCYMLFYIVVCPFVLFAVQ